MGLKIIQTDNNYTHVALSGRLDINGIKDMEMDFTSTVVGKGKSVIVDMTEVNFIASLGMRMLLSAAKNLRSQGKKVVLYNPQPVVQEALETAGFSTLMTIENDFAAALAAVQ